MEEGNPSARMNLAGSTADALTIAGSPTRLVLNLSNPAHGYGQVIKYQVGEWLFRRLTSSDGPEHTFRAALLYLAPLQDKTGNGSALENEMLYSFRSRFFFVSVTVGSVSMTFRQENPKSACNVRREAVVHYLVRKSGHLILLLTLAARLHAQTTEPAEPAPEI